MLEQDRPLASLIKGLIHDVGNLIRSELRLARAETLEKVDQAQKGITLLVIGFFTAFLALMVFISALVLALSKIIEAWVAALFIGGMLTIIAAGFLGQGLISLRSQNLMPKRTLKSVGADKQIIEEKLR